MIFRDITNMVWKKVSELGFLSVQWFTRASLRIVSLKILLK